LSDVISGTPKVLQPYTELALYAAEYCNFYWQRSRLERGEIAGITSPPETNCHPYPSSKQEASDEAAGDKGGNFGRIVPVQACWMLTFTRLLHKIIWASNSRIG